MGNMDRVYGSIFCHVGSENSPGYAQKASAVLWALESLPLEDAYPPLTRNLFSLTAFRYGTPGLYKELAIHFALTIKGVAEDWDSWLDKFEGFLGTFEWNDARVHLEFEVAPPECLERRFAYQWTMFQDETGAERKLWTFSGGPREFGDLVGRTRACVAKAKETLESSPADVDALRTLILGLARLREYEEARACVARLEELDPEAANAIPCAYQVPWAERVLSWSRTGMAPL